LVALERFVVEIEDAALAPAAATVAGFGTLGPERFAIVPGKFLILHIDR
jgi:hypothetical protein